MTSEARHPVSPAPVVSVKARAQEIEARSGAGAKSQVQAGFPTTPVARQDTALSPKKYQAAASEESAARSDDLPSRRCSEGDIFQHCKVRQPPPTAPRPRRVSLENANLPAVPERRSTLGRLAESTESSCTREPPSQRKTTSKFTPFTAGGKGGVTNSQAATADFRPAIFSPNRLLTQPKQSPLDDIITALEKICDEFTLPEDACRRFSADQHLETSSLPRGYDDVFEKCVRRTSSAKSNHDANDKSQWLSEHGVSQVDECQKSKPNATGKYFEAKVLPDGSQSVKHSSPRREDSVGAESIVYRSGVVLSPKSKERHVVSATLFVSPPKVGAKCASGKSVYSSPSKFVSDAGKAEINTGRIAKGEKAHHVKATSENGGTNSCSLKSNYVTPSLQSKSNQKNVSIASKGEVRNVKKEDQTSLAKHNGVKSSGEELKKDDNKKAIDELKKVKKPVACKPDIPKIFANSLSLEGKSLSVNDTSRGKDENECDKTPSEELEIVKNILANLDFQKYKRRSSLDDMESKSPKPPRAQKAASAKFKDLFDLLKPSSDTSSSSKRPFGLCRSSSFSNAETTASDKDPPDLFVQNEENDAIAPLPEDTKRISTLPRRKSPSQLFTKSSSTPPASVLAVASCPSIVKLENRVAVNNETDLSYDEGLVSDSEVGPGAYVTAYVSCVTSSPKQASGRRGHVRSASDNVTSGSSTVLPEVRIKKTSSTEKLWSSVTSRLNGAEKQRKRRKGVGCKQTMGDVVQEPVKSGRSLTYPPQRKSSTSEEEQEFTSVDSNGLKSLKHQTVGLMDSSSDAVRLLSDLSLADSHLCPSEGTIEETYLDVVDSVIHSPADPQHLSVDEANTATSSKSHKKKHHSDPGGEAGSNSSGDGFIAEVIVGLVRSEPVLGSHETGVTANSSSYSSASSETSSRATQTPHFEDERPSPLKLVIDGPRNTQGTKHSRGVTGGSLTSGATSSRFHFPETDTSNQRLAIEQNQSSKSPQEQRRYSKRRLRGPYGEMLEEEMRKSGEKHKSVLNDLSFLQDIVDTGTKNQDASSASETSSQSQNRPAMFVSSQSLDDASSMSSRNELSMCVTPKRKISANYPLLTDGESVAIASDEDISPTKPPTPNEPVANSDIARNEINSDVKNECQQKNKDDVNRLHDFSKTQERHSSDGTSPPREEETQQADGRWILRRLCAAMGLAGIEKLDTRTHVVAELYDTEKSYVESLQIIAHMLCIKLNLLSSLATNLSFLWDSDLSFVTDGTLN